MHLRRCFSTLPQTFTDFVVPSYGRYTHIELSHGNGNRVWDTAGKSYLDFGGGIAVNSLGHAHPAILEAIQHQAGKIMHCSNLYLKKSTSKSKPSLRNSSQKTSSKPISLMKYRKLIDIFHGQSGNFYVLMMR